jgi:hypothetical protein
MQFKKHAVKILLTMICSARDVTAVTEVTHPVVCLEVVDLLFEHQSIRHTLHVLAAACKTKSYSRTQSIPQENDISNNRSNKNNRINIPCGLS